MKSFPFYGQLWRMRYIQRWGLMKNSRPENLSEHTLDTAIIAHCLGVLRNTRFGGSVDLGQLVLYALYHDAPEILTGDLPTPVKYHDPALSSAYKQLEELSAARLLSQLPADLQPAFAPYLLGQGQQEVLALCKAADKLSALCKCIEEQKSGSSEFESARRAQLQALRQMDLPEVDLFCELFLPGYYLSLDDLQEL